MFRFSERSLKKLEGVHPDIIKVVKRAIEITPVDFGIIHGVRTQAEQNALYEQGRTKPGKIVTWTRNSKHLKQKDGYGHAIDVAAYKKGTLSWDAELYYEIATAIKNAAKELDIMLYWGPDIGIKGDLGHFQLGEKNVRN